MGRTGAAILAILLAGATTAAAQSGPVGYWKGDDGASPTNALDSSGFGNGGVYSGGATTNAASVAPVLFPNSHSMSFTTANAIVTIGAFPWPQGGPVTVSYWSYVTTAQVRNSSAFRVGGLDQPNRFHAHAPWGDSNLYWDYGDAATPGRVSTSYTAYLNKWTHIALVSEGNNGTFKAIYLDGMLRNSATVSDGPDTALTGIVLGRWDTTLYFQGLIDDFRIYARVLPAADIARLSSGQTEPPAPTGLTATPGMGQIQLTWNAVPGVTGYILKKTPGGGSGAILIPVSGTSYTDTGLSSGWPYTYTVSAVLISEGPDSAPPVTAMTLVPPPRTGKNHRSDCGYASVPAPTVWPWGLLALAAAIGLARRR